MKPTHARPGRWNDSRDGQRVVLLDLDGTLIKSQEARIKGWKRAIKGLQPILRFSTSGAALAACQAIYACHSLISDRVGPNGHVFEDMRQEWNTKMSYALLIAWSEKHQLQPAILGSEQAHKAALENLFPVSEFTPGGWRLLERAEEINDPHNILFREHIERAVAAFWSGDWSRLVYPEVPALLSRLRKAGIDYYIATEGYLPTQWKKIQQFGLDQADSSNPRHVRLITPDRVFATSQVARFPREMHALGRLLGWYLGRAAARHEVARSPEAVQFRAALELEAAAADRTAQGIKRLAGLVRRFRQKVNRDYAGQVQPEFFMRIVQELNSLPSEPSDFTGLTTPPHEQRKLRLAMVGDKYESDILPFQSLAHKLGKVMAIRVRQGKYARIEPTRPKRTDDWLACDTIKQAVQNHLLSPKDWLRHTEILRKPETLFVSALEPAEHTTETLQGNIIDFLAGVAGVHNISNTKIREDDREVSKPGISSESTLDDEVIRRARDFVKKLSEQVVLDIRQSDSKERVIDILLDVSDPSRQDALISRCAGFSRAAMELLLAIAAEGHQRSLIAISEIMSTASAHFVKTVVEVLNEKPDVVQYIAASPELRPVFLREIDRFETLAGSVKDFPWLELSSLRSRLRVNNTNHTATSHTNTPSVPQTGIPDVTVGQRSNSGGQLRVYLGKNEDKQLVYCLLGGGEARNIICICGKPKSGKSSTINALVGGALRGDAAGVTASSVIVFRHRDPNPSSLVELGNSSRGIRDVQVFAPRSQMATVVRSYPKLSAAQIRPFVFRLKDLPNELILSWVNIGQEGAKTRLLRILEAEKENDSISGLIAAVNNVRFHGTQKADILAGLRSLKPYLAEAGERAVYDEIGPGRLTVLDFGLKAEWDLRFRVWEMMLAALDHELRPKDVDCVLVFDELHQVFRKKRAKWASLEEHLRDLVRQRRHWKVSIIASSQGPGDFALAGDLWAGADVLLIHHLDTAPESVPNGELWMVAKNQDPSMFDLDTGRAWYCSQGITGTVSVQTR